MYLIIFLINLVLWVGWLLASSPNSTSTPTASSHLADDGGGQNNWCWMPSCRARGPRVLLPATIEVPEQHLLLLVHV
jgi:hypothetical protein